MIRRLALLGAAAVITNVMTAPAMAQALITQFDPVPPAEYDRPYKGHLEVYKVGGQAEVRATGCPKSAFVALGCAFWWTNPDKCVVVLADDATIRAAGHDPEIVLHHELAHCEGWPAHHPGARPTSSFVPRPSPAVVAGNAAQFYIKYPGGITPVSSFAEARMRGSR
jgi:hypothetical protein